MVLRLVAATRHGLRVAAILCTVAMVLAIGAQPHAQSIAPVWSVTDIGNATLPGSAVVEPCEAGVDNCLAVAINAAGKGFGGKADQVTFVSQELNGDGAIVARVVGLDRSDSDPRVGLMIRESLEADSRFAYVQISSKGVFFRRRREPAAGTIWTAGTAELPIRWLKLDRRGPRVTAYESADGISWRWIGSDVLALPNNAVIGIAMSSYDAASIAGARLDNVAIHRPETLPDQWTNVDVGQPAGVGSADILAGSLRVSGAGANIGGTSDQFHYVYRAVRGNADVIAQVTSLDDLRSLTRSGIMMRESLAPGAAHASVFVTARRGVLFERRADAGLTGASTEAGAGHAPEWLKLERRGSVVAVFRSVDGQTWTLIATDTVNLPGEYYVGLAVTSRDEGQLANSVIDNVTINELNERPTVSLAVPGGATYSQRPAEIVLAASAEDSDGTVARVDFFAGQTLIGSATEAPFTFRWTGVTAGAYDLTAVAYDEFDLSAVSSVVSVTVAENRKPQVVLTSPTPTVYAEAPAAIDITAAASDADGTINRVEFFAGVMSLGVATEAPYAIRWSDITPGTVVLSAVAYDGEGSQSEAASVTVHIPVNQVPSVSLTSPSSTVFASPATITVGATASDADGSISRVDFYVGSVLLGSSSAAPYSVVWSGAAAGSYLLTAVAYDESGLSSTSTPIVITVTAEIAPQRWEAVFAASADHDTNVDRYVLEVYKSGPELGAPIATYDLGKPEVVSGDCRVDVTSAIRGLAEGGYDTRVRAINPFGASVSNTAAIVR